MIELDLRDIHLPDTSLWLPPAPGWWLLVLLLLVLGLIVWWLKRPRRNPVKQVSLRELKQIRRDFETGQEDRIVLAKVSALLRRILISYHGREGFAGSTGETWQAQLTSLSPQREFSQAQLELLSRERYQRNIECDIGDLLRECDSWIRSLPRGHAHVSD